MTFFRDLFVDLVDKRLWPVAAVLVGALVVVPLVLSKSPSSTDTRAAVAQPANAPEVPGQRVSLGGSEPSVSVHGKQSDPFQQKFLPKSATAASGLGAAVASAAGSSSTPSLTTNPGGVSSGGVSSNLAPGSTSGGGTGVTNTSDPTSKVQVSFGLASGKLKTYKLAALNALPGNGDPVLIFTGLQKDGKTAVFLVTSDATSQGDGKCSPTRTVCSSVLMKAGEVEFLDVVDASGGTVQYELDMQDVLHK